MLGAALSCALASSAMAAGPLQVTTGPAAGGGAFSADLAGIATGLEPPVDVQPAGPQPLEFRLLANNGYVSALDVDGSSFSTPVQAFSTTGTLLGTVTSGSDFLGLISDTNTFGPDGPNAWGTYDVYLSNTDVALLSGIGPFVGDVDHLFFSIDQPGGGSGGGALFEVSVASVPEPTTWAMVLLGVGGIGATLRTSRRRTVEAVSA